MVEPYKNEEAKDFIFRCVPIIQAYGKDLKESIIICKFYWNYSKRKSYKNKNK